MQSTWAAQFTPCLHQSSGSTSTRPASPPFWSLTYLRPPPGSSGQPKTRQAASAYLCKSGTHLCAGHAAPAPYSASRAQLPPASLGMLPWHRTHLYQPVFRTSQQSVPQHTDQGIMHLSARLLAAGSPSAEHSLSACLSTHQTSAVTFWQGCAVPQEADCTEQLHRSAQLSCQHIGALLCSGGLPAPPSLQSAGAPEPEPA